MAMYDLEADPILLTKREAAAMLRVSPGVFLDLVKQGLFHEPIWFGPQTPRWFRSELEREALALRATHTLSDAVRAAQAAELGRRRREGAERKARLPDKQ